MTQDQHAHPRRLNRQDYKTLSLAALGGALEFYDFIIFVFFAAVIGDLFFPPDIPEWLRQVQTFGIFAAGYLARPLGGIIMAHFGDKSGRKKMFSLSILLMALPTLAMGLLPTYEAIGIAAPLLLLLMRVLQGAAIGGEVPGAWVFVAEHVPRARIGFACGTLTAGLTMGILLGSLIATLLNTVLTPEQMSGGGWRLPFFIGGVFGLVAMYLRRWLQETPIFMEMREQKKLAEELPLKSVVLNHKRAVVVSMLLTWLLSACIVVVILMAPTYLQKVHGIPAALALQANCLATIALMVGCVGAGLLVDRFGASKLFIVGSLSLAACSWFFYSSAASSTTLLFVSYAIVGLSVGVVGGVPYVMVRAFPAAVRFSGISFSYNVSYAIFGGLTPVFVTLIMKATPMAPAFYVLTLAAVGLLLGIYLQRDLDADSQVSADSEARDRSPVEV
ncbi:MFS transporter [Pectobacterium carotovorum]|uniref:MFS transporter n=1 Tax=Pectobacterium carotovorum subsp. carotovorum TaxID=555 RepID=A0AAI9L129_PECCC|nr:MFS transporter [Pectobacterium carotovorum]MBL0865642.1 MFS transporter [Pectobacterium carotovorum]MCQ8232442.1 MFS transporter [Pectobacterium carotovorum]GKV91217.1 MFS transporter [Pectobacterium carotovorum subsp. carotovorum]GKW08455.1 MFS transporter [Pectobacterium carotovorum subsp. carotovorum]GKX47112.1 MFS transporter [Pectobacterium carotovorum subsp. carotovorum]